MLQLIGVQGHDHQARARRGIGDEPDPIAFRRAIDVRHRDHQRGRSRVDRVRKQQRRGAARHPDDLRQRRMHARERRREIGGPCHRRERACGWFQLPQLCRIERLALGEIHRPDQSGNPCRGLPSGVRIGEDGRRITVQLFASNLEREIGARQLAVEFLREFRGARAKARAHALALCVAHLAEPAVLQRREDREQHEQDRGGKQLPWSAAHERTVREKRRPHSPLYISYKTIAER